MVQNRTLTTAWKGLHGKEFYDTPSLRYTGFWLYLASAIYLGPQRRPL
jgi:hypothetical protein